MKRNIKLITLYMIGVAVASLLLSLSTTAQTVATTKHLITAVPYPPIAPNHGGTKIPFMVSQPPDADQTLAGNPAFKYKKYPVIIFFHGIGERTDNFTSPTSVDMSELDDLYTTAPMSALHFTTSSLYGKRYAARGSTDSTQFFYIAPQVYGGYDFTWLVYPWNMIKWVKDSMSHIIDTNRIYLTGLSFGGGAVNCAIQDSLINRQVAAAAAVCPGYRSYSGMNPTGNPVLIGSSYYNFPLVARSGINVWWFHATNDPQTTGCGTPGSSCSIRMIDSIKKYNPVGQMNFYQYDAATHFIWDWVYLPSNANTARNMINGESVTMQLRLEEWFLQFSTHGYRRGTIK